jgi:hypothetical protein
MSKLSTTRVLQGEEILDRVDEIVRAIGENFFELGARLYEIKHVEIYKERNYGSWVEWCDEALPFQYRKADHYIELWELFCQKLGYDYREIQHIGWSKLIKVKGLIENKRDAKKWLKKCETMGRRALEKAVADEKVTRAGADPEPERPPVEKIAHDLDLELENVDTDTDSPFVNPDVITHEEIDYEDGETGETIPLHEFKVFLFQEQWKAVMAALERAGQIANSNKPGHLLNLICEEFSQTFSAAEDGGAAHALERYVQGLEKLFEVKISVEVPEGSAIRRMSRIDDEGKRLPKKKRNPEPLRW